MHYSLKEIIARLYLKTYLGQDKNKSWKVKFLEELFGAPDKFYNPPDGFFNGNYFREKTVDIPQLTHHNVAMPIYDAFNNDNINNDYIKKLFENLNNLWNRLHPNTRDLLFKHRRDIFGDFRYDSVSYFTLDKFDNDLPKNIENLLEAESEKAFIYAILLFILIAIFHEKIAADPVSVVFKKETIESILEIEFSKNKYPAPILNTLNGPVTTEHSVPFVHEQYKNFAIYLYNDHGESTTDFCSGNIEFSANGIVNLSFQDKPLNKTIHYNGTAHLFKENRLVYMILENKLTHRGAIICFHFTEFKEDPKCYLRKGLFISTAEGDEHHRPFVKNIIFLHQESEQQELIEGLLKCCDMREADEFIIIRDKKLTQFINKLYEFDFMDSLKDDKTYFEKFLRKYSAVTDTDENAYCLIRENSFHDWLKNRYPDEIDELQRKKVLLMLKYFSEMPDAIYPYTTKDTTYHIFK